MEAEQTGVVEAVGGDLKIDLIKSVDITGFITFSTLGSVGSGVCVMEEPVSDAITVLDITWEVEATDEAGVTDLF